MTIYPTLAAITLDWSELVIAEDIRTFTAS